MNLSTRFAVAAAIATSLVCGRAGAHHALNAFFDLETPIRVEGTLTSVRWVNPHIAFEVESAFEAPLSHFLTASRYQRREYRFRGRDRHYMAIPYEGRYIWVATAGMLYALCRVLAR